jgi:hypothetical protein
MILEIAIEAAESATFPWALRVSLVGLRCAWK